MKKIKFISLFISLAFLGIVVSCGSTANVTTPTTPAPEQVVEVKQEEQPVVVEKSAEDLEFSRSIGEAAISRDVFNEDKAAIQTIIKELDIVMKKYDYKAWLTYLDQESINYWQKPVNLKKASSKLPKKGQILRTLEDYFKFVFVPSRAGRDVPEIRYASNTYVKAVQFQDETDIIYYHFNKIDGKWMLHLPPLD